MPTFLALQYIHLQANLLKAKNSPKNTPFAGGEYIIWTPREKSQNCGESVFASLRHQIGLHIDLLIRREADLRCCIGAPLYPYEGTYL
jgi:hypothetical protein